MSKVSLVTLPIVLAALIGGGSNAGAAIEATALANQSFASGWSQKAELAADYGALQFLAKSKYNPTGLLTLMERTAVEERGSNEDLGIFRTHPPSRARADQIIGYMKQANMPIHRSAVSTSLSTQLKPGENGVVEAWFSGKRIYSFAGPDALQRADAAVKTLNAFYDDVPALYDAELSGTQVTGKGKELFEMTPDDAKALNLTPEDLAAQTLKNLKGSLFTLNFMVSDQF
jgi:hypothetical protein